MGTQHYWTPEPYRIPVEVVAGQTSYLGSFVVYDRTHIDPCAGRAHDIRMILQNRAKIDIPAIADVTQKAGYPIVAIPITESRAPTLITCAYKDPVADAPMAPEPTPEGAAASD